MSEHLRAEYEALRADGYSERGAVLLLASRIGVDASRIRKKLGLAKPKAKQEAAVK